MLPEFLHPLLEWAASHPTWIGVLVFAVSLLESIAVFGLLMPGAILLFGIGALMAAGSIPLLPVLVWGALGAVVGDGVSYWFGRHYRQQLRVMWPFRRYPRLVNRGVEFCHHHGGKSVFLARFVGPVRPIVPAVVGMLQMPATKFFAIDVFAAILWAPAYILPGVVFGASLGLATEVAGRLAVLLVLLLCLLWFSVWMIQRVFAAVQPQATALLSRWLEWSQRHPRIRPLASALLDPDHPEARGLAALALILFCTFWVFTLLFAEVLAGSHVSGIDRLVFHALQGLRTPWADRLMVHITELGDSIVLVILFGVVLLWLLWKKRWSTAKHWLAAYGVVTALTYAIKFITRTPRPLPLFEGLDAHSFPSGHVSVSIAVYGFLAVLLAGEMKPARRWLPYVAAALLIVPIALSRLYLGAHWLSDVLGGAALGLAWIALLGIAYRRHKRLPLGAGSLAAVALLALILSGGWHSNRQFETDQLRYIAPRTFTELDAAQWLREDWRLLPAYRLDLEDDARQPMNLQWAGNLEELRAHLLQRGWHEPKDFDFRSALRWLTPASTLEALPVLPQVHDGRHDALRLARFTARDNTLLVLRLWPSAYTFADAEQPLWVGSVSYLRLSQPLQMFTVLRTDRDFNRPLDAVAEELPPLQATWVIRTDDRSPTRLAPNWDGRTLLLMPAGKLVVGSR